MNAATVTGIIRAILAALAGFLAGKGIDITGIATPEVTGAIGIVVVSVWSAFSKKPAAATKPLDN
jgi:hypothetical protein